MNVTKVADKALVTSAGSVISYTVTVDNNGTQTLTNVTPADTLSNGASVALSLASGDVNGNGKLDVNETWVYTGTYTVTQADIDANTALVNSVSVTSTEGANGNASATTNVVKPPVATDNSIDVTEGIGSVTLDIVGDDHRGSYPLDRTSVSLTVPADATDIKTDAQGDVIGFVVPGEGTWSVDPVTGKVTFTPAEGYVGDPTPVKYSVKDTHGNNTEALIKINYPPVANPDTNNSLPLGEIATLNPLDNDKNTSYMLDPSSVSLVPPSNARNIVKDAQGDIVGFEVPNEGTWSVDETTGEVRFEPFNTLTEDPTPVYYTVREIKGDVSNRAELRISYINAAAQPVAVDDTLIVNHYGGNSGTVVDNDHLGVGTQAEHRWTLVTQPKHGKVEFNNDGTFTYYPEANYNGSDSFDYIITDKAGRTSRATVRVTVDCASSQRSDSGDALGWTGMLMMLFMMTMVGFYFARKEEEGWE